MASPKTAYWFSQRHPDSPKRPDNPANDQAFDFRAVEPLPAIRNGNIAKMADLPRKRPGRSAWLALDYKNLEILRLPPQTEHAAAAMMGNSTGARLDPEPRSKQIKLPVSARNRSAHSQAWEMLIGSVHEHSGFAFGGFEFRGVFLRYGGTLPETALHPDPAYPQQALILECAGPAETEGYLWVLWLWDNARKPSAWRELGRAASRGTEWARSLGPLAQQALAEQGVIPRKAPARDLSPVTGRLAQLFEAELQAFEGEDRGVVASVVHDLLAARISRWLEQADAGKESPGSGRHLHENPCPGRTACLPD